MVVSLDHLDTYGKRVMTIVGLCFGIVLSYVTTVLRIWVKKTTAGQLKAEDWFMVAALLLSNVIIISEFWSLSVGLGYHASELPKEEVSKFILSIFIFARVYQFNLFCLKTSILLLYVRLFPMPQFKRVALYIWIYTVLWTIAAFFSTLFQCLPVAYFYDKSIPGGRCLPHALQSVNVSNGVLSCIGDIAILCMPLPVIWKLQMNSRRKMALSGILLMGIFATATSIIRVVALFGIDPTDITFTNVESGLWSYLEVSMGITCGNLPLLRPLFSRFFEKGSNSLSAHQGGKYGGYGHSSNNIVGSSQLGNISSYRSDGFELMMDKNGPSVDAESLSGSGTDIELPERRSAGQGIKVETNVVLTVDDLPSRNERSENRFRDPLQSATTTSVRAGRMIQ